MSARAPTSNGAGSGVPAAVTWWVHQALPSAGSTATASTERAGTASHGSRWFPAGSTMMILAALLMGLSSAAVWTFGRDLITTVGGASVLVSTTMWTTLGAAGIVGALGGDLVAHAGLAHSWTVAMVIMSAATAALALAPGSAPVIVVAAGVFGASYIILTALALLWSTRLYRTRPSFGVGLAFLTIALGQAIGAPLAGSLTDTAGSATAFHACAGLGLLGAFARPGRAVSARPRARP